ncbi:MAG: RHS repeat-associated core domain-containing protein [Bacteroidetes bacterium]|nr:RHS repeat-associated core domain-containing protein [Bacteroidota bacterium]
MITNNYISNYYPDECRFGFNGQEKDDEIKGTGNSLDFGARIYDPRIGRWLALDPLQAKYPDLSPYNFCANNPIIFIDPNGKEIDIAQSKGLQEFKRDLRRTALGRELWDDMKKTKTLIRVVVYEEVLVERTSNGTYSITPGYFSPDGDPIENKKEPIHRFRAYYRSGELAISSGASNLLKNVMKIYGEKWEKLSDEERNAAMQKELNSGKYKIKEINDKKVNGPILLNSSSLTDKYASKGEDVKSDIPTSFEGDESLDFIKNIFSVHESTHSIWDAYNELHENRGSKEIRPFKNEKKTKAQQNPKK